MTSNPRYDAAYVWFWLPGSTEPAVAGRIARDGDRLIFNYGRSYLSRPDRIALYEPDIPQNTGTILRLAACLDVAVDIIEPCGFPFDDRRMRRAGMDYLDAVDLSRQRNDAADDLGAQVVHEISEGVHVRGLGIIDEDRTVRAVENKQAARSGGTDGSGGEEIADMVQ